MSQKVRFISDVILSEQSKSKDLQLKRSTCLICLGGAMNLWDSSRQAPDTQPVSGALLHPHKFTRCSRPRQTLRGEVF
jgi:hypothetical protein